MFANTSIPDLRGPTPRRPSSGESDFRRRAPQLSAVTDPGVLYGPHALSNGDEAGATLGLTSGTLLGPDRPVLGSVKTAVGTTPTQRLTPQGAPPTAPGVSLAPAQVRPIMLD